MRKLLRISYVAHKINDWVRSKIVVFVGPQQPLPVRARPTPRRPVSPKPSFKAPFRVGDAVVGRGKCWMDNIKEWASFAYARAAHKDLLLKRLEEDLR